MPLWSWADHDVISVVARGMWSEGGRWDVGVAVGVTAVAGIALVATLVISSRRGSLKSPWSTRRRKQALNRDLWDSLFAYDGKLRNGESLLKKVRSGGIEPNVRPLVWPFLLGVYDLNSSEEQREVSRIQRRKAYKILRKKCKVFSGSSEKILANELNKVNGNESCKECDQAGAGEPGVNQSSGGGVDTDMNGSKGSKNEVELDNVNRKDGCKEADYLSADESRSCVSDDERHESSGSGTDTDTGESIPFLKNAVGSHSCIEADETSSVTDIGTPPRDCESSESEISVEDSEGLQLLTDILKCEEFGRDGENLLGKSPLERNSHKSHRPDEGFLTWQRIIRLDAIRANDEWISYAPEQTKVSAERAHRYAEKVGLQDYDHLETCRIYHAARLVAILEAYAVYDPEIGYCQGMSDLLSPILAVMEKDDEAFWCFVGFMRKARHNFRLDEIGIRRQLNMVSKIIKFKDMHLYRHLEKLQAEDCFFVYRMVVVLFRRELNFEQILCLWEVIWADQAAIRIGIGKSPWSRIRLSAPPTDDLLLYAIAASVLQRRKLIIEKYSSMEEIMKECHSMAGHLDVWKLLDDAHDLVLMLTKKYHSFTHFHGKDVSISIMQACFILPYEMLA